MSPWMLQVPVQPDGPLSVEDRYAERESGPVVPDCYAEGTALAKPLPARPDAAHALLPLQNEATEIRDAAQRLICDLGRVIEGMER